MKQWFQILGILLAGGIATELYWWFMPVDGGGSPKPSPRQAKQRPSAKTTKKERSAPIAAQSPKDQTDWPVSSWTVKGKQRIIKHKDIAAIAGCSYQIRAKHLAAISDRGLQEAGISARSPIVVLEKGSPLQPFAPPSSKWETCAGRSHFYDRAIRFSPTNENTRLTDYQLALHQDLPLVVDGQASWWLYNGYRMQTTIPKQPQRAGKEIALHVKIRAVGRIMPHPPTLIAAKETLALKQEGSFFVGTLTLRVPSKAWNISLRAHKKSSLLIVETLQVQSDEQTFSLLSITP